MLHAPNAACTILYDVFNIIDGYKILNERGFDVWLGIFYLLVILKDPSEFQAYHESLI